MKNFEPVARFVITWVVTLLIPFALILTGIRLLLTPVFLQYEYNRPGFPADTYGFSTADRLTLGQISLNYLLNDAGIEYLGGQRLPDGTPLYNQRELSHMDDVKRLVQLALKVWQASLGLVIGLGLAAWGARWSDSYKRGLARGGWLTLGLIAFVLVNVFVSFDALFTAFHRIFFTGDTWIFLFTDTLIRLFPIPLWQDTFIITGAFALIGSLLLIFVFSRPFSTRAIAVGK